MKKFIQQVSKVALVVVGVMTFVTAQAQITIIPSPYGGNDNGSFQSFGFTNTTQSGVYYNRTNGLGSFADVSAFEYATLVFSATNSYSTPVTNQFTILKGFGNGPVTSFETTATLPTYTVVVPGNSFVLWTTNLTFNDIAGIGFLEVGSYTNTAPNSTNGYYALGWTNIFGLSTNSLGIVTGTTNIVGYPVTFGVATKVLHSLR